MKYCTNCGKPVDENACVCVNCGFKLKEDIQTQTTNKKKKTWVIPLVIVLFLFFIINIFSETDSEESNNTDIGSNNNSIKTQESIDYIKVSKDDLDDALENNAAVARETYINKYVEVYGKLGTIDSELKYISLRSSTKNWDFNGITCYIKTKEQKEVVKTLSKDQYITVRGKVTDVGEVLGYYLDITEIIAD